MWPPQAPLAEATLGPAHELVAVVGEGTNAGPDTVLEQDGVHEALHGNEGPDDDNHGQQVLRED